MFILAQKSDWYVILQAIVATQSITLGGKLCIQPPLVFGKKVLIFIKIRVIINKKVERKECRYAIQSTSRE